MAKPLSLTTSLIIVVASMVANGSATLVSKGRPLDAGLTFIDGRRLLGDGKTVEGLATGLVFGTSVALFMSTLLHVPFEDLILTLLAPLFAVAGDMAMSFAKRRAGLERGSPLKPVDQLDFIIATATGYLALGYIWDPALLIIVIAVTYALHRTTNIVAYRLGIKDRPW